MATEAFQSLILQDPGSFRSRALAEFCDHRHILLDISGEGHWKLGVCERSIQAVKELMSKVRLDFP